MLISPLGLELKAAPHTPILGFATGCSYRRRLEAWLASLRAQLEPGQLNIAPLRTMVATTMTRDLVAVDDPAREHIARLMLTLDSQLRMISLR